ncbi:hypothetical protein [Endozoicomonas sp. 4G]|uniref:hypothetical protein n=1 Tax=Endozoicomonas sp. 4G TaxID=2872754 RepID=UPI0020790488|nr:hypothetical protein [Endozoicomonas sp. 4G]
MNITNHVIKLITALLITTSVCVNADITEQKKEDFLNAGLVNYDIKYLIKVGTTPEQVLLFAEKAPMISPYLIHHFTKRNIAPEIAASFHPDVVENNLFIEQILLAGLTPETANSYVEAGIDNCRAIISYAKHGVPPDLAGSLYKNKIHVTTEHSRNELQEALEHGLTTKDLPRYNGITDNTFELKKLYLSKVPVDFLHDALSNNITLEGARSLYFRGIDMETYPSLISDQQTCTVYPTTHLEFEYLGNLNGYQSKKEPIPLPKALFSRLNTLSFYGTMNCFSTDDQEEIFKYVEDMVTESNIKNPTIYRLLYMTAIIVSQKLNYEDVDRGELKSTFPKSCSIAEYWRRGIGDCDKYAVLGMVVFSQLKQLFPDVLANVYLTNELFSKELRHSWNTLVIAEEDRLIFTYIDILNLENGIDKSPKINYQNLLLVKMMQNNPFRNKNEVLGIMTPKYFNHEYFLSEYEKHFCKPAQ